MQPKHARKSPGKIAERNHDTVEHVYKSKQISHAASLTFTKAPAEERFVREKATGIFPIQWPS